MHDRRQISGISANLSVELSAHVAAQYVFDEFYWKRRYTHTYGQRVPQIRKIALIWKQRYFEAYIQEVASYPCVYDYSLSYWKVRGALHQ